MMDYVQPNKMFDIVVTDSPGPEADGKVDLQLVSHHPFIVQTSNQFKLDYKSRFHKIEVDANDAFVAKTALGNIGPPTSKDMDT